MNDQTKNLPAKRPGASFPWRGVTAGLLGAAVFLGSYFGTVLGFWMSAFWGGLTYLGMTLFLGFDPRPPKPWELPSGLTKQDFKTAIKKAQDQIAEIRNANKEIPSAAATDLLNRISDLAEQIVGLFLRDPKDMLRGAKFLDIYLGSVTQIAAKYADTHQRVECEKLDAQFLKLLMQIEGSFREQHQHLLKDDVLNLDVDMEVLSKRLHREGL